MSKPIKINKLNCKIANIAPDPKLAGRWIIAVSVSDGKEEWKKPFSIMTPNVPMSLEAFVDILKEQDLSKPKDPLRYLREAIEKQEEFTIEVEA